MIKCFSEDYCATLTSITTIFCYSFFLINTFFCHVAFKIFWLHPKCLPLDKNNDRSTIIMYIIRLCGVVTASQNFNQIFKFHRQSIKTQTI